MVPARVPYRTEAQTTAKEAKTSFPPALLGSQLGFVTKEISKRQAYNLLNLSIFVILGPS